MMAVRVEPDPEFRFQPPEVLFEGGYFLGRRPTTMSDRTGGF